MAGDDQLAPGDEARPDAPGAGETICPTCSGSGRVEDEACPDCDGRGTVLKAIGGA
jgi:RecJ-like exonuclease